MNKEERAAYHKNYREKNRERIAAHQKKYRKENREKIAAYQKKYRKENREKIAALQKNHYEKNRERILAHHKKYQKENHEKISARQKKYRKKNRERIAAQQKKYQKENRERISARQKKYEAHLKNDPITRKEYALKRLLCGAYTRSKDKNLEYNLDYNWAVENFKETCPVFGIPLTFFTKTASSATIDRFDNTKGYTKENCRFISWKANSIKSTSSVTEMEKLYKWMLKEQVRQQVYEKLN